MSCNVMGRRAVVALVLAAAAGLAQARLDFAWSLLDWAPEVAPGQTLALHAVLFNTPASTEVLRGDRLAAVFAEDIEDAFRFADALPPLAEQLRGLALQPGESFSFDVGRFVPVGTPAAGRYSGGGLGLAFLDDAGTEQSWSPDRTLVVTVRDGAPSPVPAPPVPALMLAAAALAAGQRLRRGGSRCR